MSPAAPGEDCSDPYVASLPGTFPGDTSGARDDYDPLPVGCTGANAAGPDHVYRLTPGASTRIDVVLSPTAPGYDASLYVLSPVCLTASNCTAGVDRRGPGVPEAIEFLPVGPGDHFLIVDGFRDVIPNSRPAGPYLLEVRESVSPDCAGPRPVPFLPALDGLDTGFGLSLLDPSPACGIAIPQAGPEVVYALAASYPVDVEATLVPVGFDASLYALADCTRPTTTCLAGSDVSGVGSVERLTVALAAGIPSYLVVDGATGSGAYTLLLRAGETCATAVPVRTLPFTAEGDADAALDDINQATSACTGARTQGTDVVYALEPASDAFLDLRLEPLDGAYDPALYVVRDCANPVASCVAGADAGFDGDPEVLEGIYVFGGETLYAVVDAFFPGERSFYRFSATSSPRVRLYAVKAGAEVELRFAGAVSPYTILRDGDPRFPAPFQDTAPGPLYRDGAAPAGTSYYRVDS